MNRFGMSVCALVCFAASQQVSIAQSSPWNGSWKADAASVKYDGPTFSVAVDADGYTVTRGGKAGPKTVCDGKPQKSDDTMVTCSKSGSEYAIGITKDGKTTRKVTLSVAADGKTRTAKTENFPADGSPFTTTTISKRVSGGPGLAGEWKEVSSTSTADTGVLSIEVKGNMIAFKETDIDKPVECKLDGSKTKSGNGTVAIKLADPHTLKVTYSGDGKVRRENTFVLSADGKTITETDVTPATSVSTLTLKLHKS